MTSTAGSEQPGFEADENERPAGSDNGSDKTLEDGPAADGEQAGDLEQVQEEAAEERKEGGYQ